MTIPTERFRALLDGATKGTWKLRGSKMIGVEDTGGMRVGMYPNIGQVYRDPDSRLIIACVNVAAEIGEWWEAHTETPRSEDRMRDADFDLHAALTREITKENP